MNERSLENMYTLNVGDLYHPCLIPRLQSKTTFTKSVQLKKLNNQSQSHFQSYLTVKKVTNTHCGDVNWRSQQKFHTLQCKVLQQRPVVGMLRAIHRWVRNAIQWRIQFKNFADFCHAHYLTLSILNNYMQRLIYFQPQSSSYLNL